MKKNITPPFLIPSSSGREGDISSYGLTVEESCKRAKYIIDNKLGIIKICDLKEIILNNYFKESGFFIINGELFGIIQKMTKENVEELLEVVYKISIDEGLPELYNLFIEKYKIKIK